MTDAEKLQAYEAMQCFVRQRYEAAAQKLDALKAAGKTKTASYREALGDKLFYKNVLALYTTHGLIENEEVLPCPKL